MASLCLLPQGNNHGKDKEREKNLSIKGDTTYVHKSSLRSSQRIIPGHNESWSSQKPPLWDSSWLGYASAPQGRVLRQINQRGQRKVTGLRGHEDLENCTFLKNWHFPKVGLSLWASPCVFLHVLFLSINFFLYSLPCASSSEFFLD